MNEKKIDIDSAPTIRIKPHMDEHKGERWLCPVDDTSRNLMRHLGYPAVEPEHRCEFNALVAAHGWKCVIVEENEGGVEV